MNYHTLGNSELRISEIGFGCMSLESSKDNTSLLHQALDSGINYFDTADMYDKGQSEMMLGKALQGKRDKAVIATKVGNRWRSDGSGWDWVPSKAYILQEVEESLRRLQTDYIDLYQLHGGTLEDPVDDIIAAFEQLQEQGKIRHYGISSIRPNVIREYVKRSRIVSVMMQYSLLDRRPEETCLPLLQQHHISVLARGPVAKGLLAGKPATAFLDHTEEDVEMAAQAVAGLSGKERDAAQTAIRFVLQQLGITAAVVGIRTQEQLAAATGVQATPMLTAADIATLQQAAKAGKYEQHR